jgi:hypothetical protein
LGNCGVHRRDLRWPVHVGSSRPVSAKTGHSPTAWRTGQIDPKRVCDAKRKFPQSIEVAPKERGLCGDLFVKAAAFRRLRGTGRCSQARKRIGMPTSRHVPSGTPTVMAAGAGVGATSTSSDSR